MDAKAVFGLALALGGLTVVWLIVTGQLTRDTTGAIILFSPLKAPAPSTSTPVVGATPATGIGQTGGGGFDSSTSTGTNTGGGFDSPAVSTTAAQAIASTGYIAALPSFIDAMQLGG